MKMLRWITHGWLLAALVSVSASLLHPVPAGATVVNGDTTDQSQTTGTYEMVIGGTSPASWSKVAQIVTVGSPGFLDRVRLYVDNATAPATGVVSISIQTLNNGLPSGTVIGTGQIPVSSLPPSGAPNWVDVKISGTLKLLMTPGTKYAIVLSAPTSGVMRWYAAGNVYAGGEALVYSGGSWGNLSADARFQTCVIEDRIDLDQEVTAYLWGLGTMPEGQTFTAASTGILDQVWVQLGNFRTQVALIGVSVRTVDSNGMPTNTQVASGTITLSPSDNYAWGICKVTPLVVTAGTKYAVLFTTSAVGITWVVAGNVYSGGQLVSGRSGGTWVSDGAYDGTFLTWVIPPILDQRQTVGQDYGILPTGGGAQVPFTPTWSGKLTDVDVQVANRPPLAGVTFALSTPPSVTVNIKDGTGQKIGEGTTFSYPFSDSPLWFRSLISGTTEPLVNVTAGSTYGINLTASDGGLYWLYSGSLPDYNYASYILPYVEIVSGPAPPPSEAVTPCSGGVCPKAIGGFTPATQPGGITSRFLFQELPDGKVASVLAFNDPSPGGISLKGCTTGSEACTLTVANFTCSDAHSVHITGTYTLGDETSKNFVLDLSGVAKEPGTFALKAGEYQYILTQADIVDVTCPPVAGAVL